MRHLHSIHSCQRWLYNSFHSCSRRWSFYPLASRHPLHVTLVLLCCSSFFLNHPTPAWCPHRLAAETLPCVSVPVCRPRVMYGSHTRLPWSRQGALAATASRTTAAAWPAPPRPPAPLRSTSSRHARITRRIQPLPASLACSPVNAASCSHPPLLQVCVGVLHHVPWWT